MRHSFCVLWLTHANDLCQSHGRKHAFALTQRTKAIRSRRAESSGVFNTDRGDPSPPLRTCCAANDGNVQAGSGGDRHGFRAGNLSCAKVRVEGELLLGGLGAVNVPSLGGVCLARDDWVRHGNGKIVAFDLREKLRACTHEGQRKCRKLIRKRRTRKCRAP